MASYNRTSLCTTYRCGQCLETFSELRDLMAHRRVCHPDDLPDHHGDALPADCKQVICRYLHRHALNNAARVIRYGTENGERFLLPERFFDLAMPHIFESYVRLLEEDEEVVCTSSSKYA